MKRTVAPSSEPRKTRKAALLESDNKTEAKVQKKRSSDATESSGSPAKISKASHVIVAAATSPATQRIKAAEWAAEQYQLKPKKAKTPVKSPSKSSAVEDKPPVIRRPRKSISTMEAEVLEPVADGVTQPTRSMRPRRTVWVSVSAIPFQSCPFLLFNYEIVSYIWYCNKQFEWALIWVHLTSIHFHLQGD